MMNQNTNPSISSPRDETGAVIKTLQKVLVDLEYSRHGVIDTTALVTSLQLPTTEQQDVVEFGELLFGLLNNSIPSLQVEYTYMHFPLISSIVHLALY